MQGYCNIASCGAFFESIEQLGLAPQDFGSGGIQGNHAARSTSGKAAIRPLSGGHSISKELLISDAVSKSASPQKAIT